MYEPKPSVEETCQYYLGISDDVEKVVEHYGMPRRSGRYPWGSGDNPYQRTRDFLARRSELKSQGLSDKEIMESMKLNSSQYRRMISISNSERRATEVERAKDLRDKGYSLNEIASMMGYKNDSSIRSLLNTKSETRMNQARSTADLLKKIIDEKGMIDVGAGVEHELGISKEKLNEALTLLEMQGYPVYGGRVPQATNKNQMTTIKVVCPPGTEHKEIFDFGKINTINDYTSHDNGETFDKLVYPKSLNPDRVGIRYAEDGGLNKDGVIEIRRGVSDLDLGNSHYAQVRILVGKDRYLKGMAVYSDNLPDGVDIMFNTNKKTGTPKDKVLKETKDDPDNPFGALIKANGQSYYIDKDGKRQLSPINKTREEGDWGEWAKKLPSQFLSKQSLQLIKKQLGLAQADKDAEFEEIMSLTNPTVKKALLDTFANDCDTASVHLYAAALPRQKYQVILPLTSISDREVYAPQYNDGETVALIRYPHGGTFEIPILKVNNKNPEGKKNYGNALDAVGISSSVAERLSGADFDGDTVMVIPCNSSKSKVKIVSSNRLEGLKDFDPKTKYGSDYSDKDSKGEEHYYRNGHEYKIMSKGLTQTEMGKISNLITDMTLKGADETELAAAVRHSMVVIDANKHHLDYKQSFDDNRIAALKKKYQGTVDEDGSYHEGASTLISRAKSKQIVTKRVGSPIIDKKTGEVSYKESYEEYIDKNGKTKHRTQDSTKMAETKDARTLSSGTPQEELYAQYANHMKRLANDARKEMVNAGKISYSPSAKKAYSKEVKELEDQLRDAQLNAPRERRANLIANTIVKAKKAENPDLTNKEISKLSQQALKSARETVGAKRTTIKITDAQWEAIQAGAVTESVLKQIIKNTDIGDLRERATPRTQTQLSQSKIQKILTMSASGYTSAEIAESIGISSSSVSKYIKENGGKAA